MRVSHFIKSDLFDLFRKLIFPFKVLENIFSGLVIEFFTNQSFLCQLSGIFDRNCLMYFSNIFIYKGMSERRFIYFIVSIFSIAVNVEHNVFFEFCLVADS